MPVTVRGVPKATGLAPDPEGPSRLLWLQGWAWEPPPAGPATSSSVWPVNLRSVFRLDPVSRSSP